MDSVLNALLIVSILLAVVSVGYAVTVPKQGDAFTEQYLLTEQENGTLVADNYPTEFEAGETRPIVVGIGNHENRNVTYFLVVKLQEVGVENNSPTVLNETELGRFQIQVMDGEIHFQKLNISPKMTGTRLRLAFLLYKDRPPANPTLENAYRETRLWINVSAPQ